MTQLEIENAIRDLQKQMKELHASSSIPFEVDVAFKRRLGITDIPVLAVSDKALNSEDQAVNESGAGTYNVLKDPDAWLVVRVSGTSYYIPVFT